MEFSVQDAVEWFVKTNERIQKNKAYLTSLDQPIGDSDHGINMARGFQEVENKITSQNYETVSDVFKDVAMTLISKVGGASGPLFGTAFLKMSMALKGNNENVDYPVFSKGLEEALAGVKQRGKAVEGEKTMVDVWSPVVDHFNQTSDFQAELIADVARKAMEDTKEMMATKGRAAYFKENSMGHIDPGSASSYYIFDALAEVLKGSA